MDQRPRITRYQYRSARQPVTRFVVDQPVKHRISFKKLMIAPVLLIVVLVGWNVSTHNNQSKSAVPAVAAAATVKETKQIDVAALSTGINQIIAAHPELDMSVATVDMDSGQSQHFGVGVPFIAASTAKLITASLFLHRVEQGSVHLDDMVAGKSAKEQLRLMIVESDNDAWQGFNDLLGHPALNEYAKGIGLSNYNSDGNLLTADDIATLLQGLYAHKLLNNAHTNLLLSFMQNAKEAEYIPAAVPAGTTVYHKAGYLDDRAHDAAIIDNGKRSYVLVVFTKARGSRDYDFNAGISLFHEITKVTNGIYL